MRVLASAVLAFEALVVALAIPVAITTQDVDGATAGAAGGGLAVACLVVAGLLRYRWAYLAGSGLQVVAVASGLVVPAMFLLGGVFAVLWVVALRIGSRYGDAAGEGRTPPEPSSESGR
ncbi:MAG: DUF4233 domain-containing protein [Actinomycetes bacterium]